MVDSEYFYGLGKSMCQIVKKKMGIEESDANAVAAVMNAVLERAAGIKGALRVESDKVICENVGFSPIMEAVRIMKPSERSCVETIRGVGFEELGE